MNNQPINNGPAPVDYAINLPVYRKGFSVGGLFGEKGKGVLRVENPFGATIVGGTPGSGKTYNIIQNVIQQTSRKGFTQFVFDGKWGDLIPFTYNEFRVNQPVYVEKYGQVPSFTNICFSDPCLSNRCNPLHPDTLANVMNAMEVAEPILLNLNKSWITKQGDFFVESGIRYLAACIWFLKQYRGGEFCTLPHLIEFVNRDFKQVIPLLMSVNELEELVKPFSVHLSAGADDHIEGVIAAVYIPLGRLKNPSMYWVLSGDDFGLAVNDPENSGVVCMGGAVEEIAYHFPYALLISTALKACNKRDRLPSAFIFEEFLGSLYLPSYDMTLATCQSNRMSLWTTLLGHKDWIRAWGASKAESLLFLMRNCFYSQTDWSDLAIPDDIPDQCQNLTQGEFVGKLAPAYAGAQSVCFHHQFLSPDETANYLLPEPYPALTEQELQANVELIEKQVLSITL